MIDHQVSTYPARLGELAPVLRRRRIGVGVDRRGQLVLARPDSIQVDFSGDDDHKKRVLELVGQVAADNADLLDHDGLEGDDDDTDVLTIRVAPDVSERGIEERWSLAPLDSELARFTRAGVRAELNHVVFGAASAVPTVLGGAVLGASAPASSATTIMTPENRAALITTAVPTIAPPFLREPLRLDGYRRPRVLVLDTGLRTTTDDTEAQPEHAFLKAPEPAWSRVHLHSEWRSDPEIDAIDDEDEPDDDRSGLLDFEAGHGTFIAGIVAQICPDAEIHPAGVLSSFGEGSVDKVRRTIRRMNRLCGPFDIVVMSFGTYLANDDPGVFGTRIPRLIGDALGVAAAGNLRSCRPYFPAALRGVIGVGALDRAGAAWFTNFGSWVDACAPAVDVVSTFFSEFTECFPGRPKRRFQEWARWSGTSFAAPKVAGAIAQQMYLHQVTAREAWQRLSTPDRLRIADLGVVFNV